MFLFCLNMPGYDRASLCFFLLPTTFLHKRLHFNFLDNSGLSWIWVCVTFVYLFMRNKSFLFLLIYYSLVANYADAQWRTPKYSNEFLSIGVGATGLAMSGAQSAYASDVTSAYWNPAGLASQTKKNELGLMHASYFGGIANYDYGAFSTKVDSLGTLAISFIRFGVDDIPDTRFLLDNGQVDYSRITSFSSSDNALFFSYGRRNVGFKGLSVGGSLKIIYRNAGKFANAWGFGLDAGIRYSYKKWQFACMARDVATTFNAWSYNTTELESTFASTGNAIPTNSVEVTLPSWTFGLTRKFSFLNERLSVMPVVDMVTTFDGKRNAPVSTKLFSMDPRIGMELSAFNIVYFRGGLAGWQKIKNFENGTDWNYQVNFGIGLKWKAIAIDYAITDLGNQAEALYSHIFSLKAMF